MSAERFFDDLARTLAEPMPRRRALGVVGASLAAALWPGARPLMARAGTSQATKCVAKQRRCQKGADGNFAEYCCPPSTAGNGEFYFCGGSDNGYACIDKCRQAGKEAGTGPWERCGDQGLCCHPTQECGQWTLRSGRKVYKGCLQKCRKIERRCGTVVGESCCPKDQVCCGDGVFRRCCELGDVCVRVQLDYGKYVKWCRPPCKVGEKRCRASCCKQTKVEILPSGFKQCECVR